MLKPECVWSFVFVHPCECGGGVVAFETVCVCAKAQTTVSACVTVDVQRAFTDLSEALWSGVLWLACSWRPSRWEAGLVGHRCDCGFDPHIHRLAHKQLHSNAIHLDFQSQVKGTVLNNADMCVCPRLFVLLFFFQNFLTRLEMNQKKQFNLTIEIVKLEKSKVKASSCKEILCVYTFPFPFILNTAAAK